MHKFASKGAEAVEIIAMRFDRGNTGDPVVTLWAEALVEVAPARTDEVVVTPATMGDPAADPAIPPADAVTKLVDVPAVIERHQLRPVTYGEDRCAALLADAGKRLVTSTAREHPDVYAALLEAGYAALAADGVIPGEDAEGAGRGERGAR